MLARFLALFILAAAFVSLAACQMPQRGPDAGAIDNPDSARPSLGYLEHRGRRHALRDLLDPAYRDASSDPVARNFDVVDYHARNDYHARRSVLNAHVGRID